jgi:hypothetical protein
LVIAARSVAFIKHAATSHAGGRPTKLHSAMAQAGALINSPSPISVDNPVYNRFSVTETSRSFSRLDQFAEFLSNTRRDPAVPSPASRRLALCLTFAHGQLFLGRPAHLHQRIDEIVNGFMLFRLAPHPYEGIEQIVNHFAFFFGHAIFYSV